MYEFITGIKTYLQRVIAYGPIVVAVELLLIGLIVWWVMRFLRGTRGARLVKGVALLLGIVYVVMFLLQKESQWNRIRFLYTRFLIFVFVSVVVAFQPEIRRALMQIGQAKLFRSLHGQIQEMVEALVDSAAYLSRNKIGAVVAIERTVGLGALMETGTLLDARVTASLLNTIFYPGSALHDMGVIVCSGRIAAAGCQFPLAEPGEVDPSLGSRHRAGLGLAQESDAVILLVSEETGRISIACEGQLHIGLEMENLREMLLGLLSPGRHRRRRRSDEKAGRAGK